MTGVLALFTRCEQKKRERKKKKEEEEGERKPFARRIYCKPLRNPVIEGSSRAPEVPGVSQRHYSGSTYPLGLARPDAQLHMHARAHTHAHTHRHTHINANHACTHTSIHLKTVIPLHLLATQKPLPPTVSGQAPLSHFVQPAPQQRQRN